MKKFFRILIFIIFISSCVLHKNDSPFREIEEESLKGFELPEGFKIELIAAEPLISDPVDMTIDDEGNMYVVEMHGYPLDINHVDRIVKLTDSNGDGIMDKRTVFVDSLVLPDGIMSWKDGILVTCAPNILYFEDTDGDGGADLVDTLLTGFALSNPQHNVSAPKFGLDNWIYLAHQGSVSTKEFADLFGDKGKEISFPNHESTSPLPVNANGRMVRFKPDSYQLEELSGNTQFGQTFDTWGHHFLVSNANHIFQEVFQRAYAMRNPNLPLPGVTNDLSDHGNACDVFPITVNPEHQLLTDVGVITSACSITAYLGNAFNREFNKNVTFVCEPVSNLIHVDKLRDEGSSFIASRIFEGKEFLASKDSWFRPVNLYIGPDGALYVVDYYRKIIEHPEWMSEDVIKSGQLYEGRDQGRIYRISTRETSAPDWMKGLNLRGMSDKDLVDLLGADNIWWRSHAQRILLHRKSPESIKLLEEMARNASNAYGRLHALWTLEGLGKLNSNLIAEALKDKEAGIRENAIKLAENHLLKDSSTLTPALIQMREDPNDKVNYQLLLTLGNIDNPEISDLKFEILKKHLKDSWFQLAMLSGKDLDKEALLSALIREKDMENEKGVSDFFEKVGDLYGKSFEGDLTGILNRITGSATDAENKEGFLKGFGHSLRNNSSFKGLSSESSKKLVNEFLSSKDENISAGLLSVIAGVGPKMSSSFLNESLTRAKQRLSSVSSVKERGNLIDFIGTTGFNEEQNYLKNILLSADQIELKRKALNAILNHLDSENLHFLLDNWGDFTPGLRSNIISAMLGNTSTSFELLNVIEKGIISKSEVNWPQSVGLMASKDLELKEKARKIFNAPVDADLEAITSKYEKGMESKKGNVEKGKGIFETDCSVCHQVRGKGGIDFGPDLGSVMAWNRKDIILNILNPNYSIARGFEFWNIKLKNGGSEQGIISSETAQSITLKKMGGKQEVLSKDEIENMEMLKASPMPTGFEQKINPEEMNDLIAYIKSTN